MKKPDWQTSGTEPDYRFSLANERTFLAWIRTALALLAGGVLLEQFAPHIRQPSALATVGATLTLIAAVLAGLSYLRWKGNEIAMRHGQPLPASSAIPFLSLCIVAVACVLGFSVLLR